MPRTPFEKARRWVSALIVLALLCVALLNDPPARPWWVSVVFDCVAFAMIVIATLGRIWASVYLSGRKSKVLCTSGPFSLSRNPLYFLSLIGAMGLSLLSESLVFVAIAAVIFLIYYNLIIRHEERRLRELFGEAFDDYCRRVPRLIPRLSGHQDDETLTIHARPLRQAVLDSSVLLWVIMILEIGKIIYRVTPGHFLPVIWHLP